MQESEKLETTSEHKEFTVFDFWDRVGITRHWGGIHATQRLIQSCNITPNQRVLEIGCGTGYTSCLLARKYQADVTAVDVLGCNEATYLKPPPQQLLALFSESSVGVPLRVLQQDEWRTVLREAGFADISSTVHALNLWKQFINNLRVDGAQRYIPAIFQSIFDPTIRTTFLKKDMLKTTLQFLPYLGYGLYVGRKV